MFWSRPVLVTKTPQIIIHLQLFLAFVNVLRISDNVLSVFERSNHEIRNQRIEKPLNTEKNFSQKISFFGQILAQIVRR